MTNNDSGAGTPSLSARLKNVFALINANEREQARAQIQQIVKTHPQNADAWYLVALLMEDKARQIQALDRVLAINPQHKAALTLKSNLGSPQTPEVSYPASPQTPGANDLPSPQTPGAGYPPMPGYPVIPMRRPASRLNVWLLVFFLSAGLVALAVFGLIVLTQLIIPAFNPPPPTNTAGTPAPMPLAGLTGKILFSALSLEDGGNNPQAIKELYTINADGTGLSKLTSRNLILLGPRWSPDGTQIAYAVQDNPNVATENNLHIMNADGTNDRQITSKMLVASFQWSPDGKRFVLAILPGIGKKPFLQVINADGTGAVQLTNSPAARYMLPAWSPDATQIAFASDREGTTEIFVMNADGSNIRRLTDPQANQGAAFPTWAPDGKRIAYAQFDKADPPTAEAIPSLYVMNADGSNPTRITTNIRYEPLSWSPDGQFIAFDALITDSRDSTSLKAGIGIVKVSTGARTDLTSALPLVAAEPSWKAQ